MDPGVQGLQGKAERVKPTDMLLRLREFYSDKAALRCRHEAIARLVGQYDINNTYQYIIAREDQHLSWVADAIASMDGAVPDGPAAGALPTGKGDAAFQAWAREDGSSLDAFVARWRERVAEVTNARHRLMLDLVLGESLEHARLLHQAGDGRLDLLGRRTGGDRVPGAVLPTRWVE
jgi:hypothetical protein